MSINRYTELEDLIFRGFIPLKVSFGDLNFVFKSVNDLEYKLCKLMSGMESSPMYSSNYHLNYLYLSLYMINGQNILPYREQHYSNIFDNLKLYPTPLISEIFTQLNSLVQKVNVCSGQIEAYSYESTSRYNWASKKNMLLNNCALTGVSGTELLGINELQKYWQVLNIREDQKDNFEEKYNLQKFLASFWDPKHVKKLEDMDKSRKEEELSRRDRIIQLGSDDGEIYCPKDPTSTKAGIIQELEKQMRGEKDEHDLAVEAHERKMRETMHQQIQEMKKMQEERRKNFTNFEEARAISPEEMRERIAKMANKQRVVINTDIDTESQSKFLQMTNIEADNLTGDIENRRINNLDEIEKTYIKQQKKLASQLGLENNELDNNFDFPNLRK